LFDLVNRAYLLSLLEETGLNEDKVNKYLDILLKKNITKEKVLRFPTAKMIEYGIPEVNVSLLEEIIKKRG
jgi:hypothetical protein